MGILQKISFPGSTRKANRICLVISDLHIGEGYAKGELNVFDEFLYDQEFYEFMEYYSSGKFSAKPVELILNGDIFDLLRVKYNGEFSDKFTADAACSKFKKCCDGHPMVIDALKLFLKAKNHTITYILGNHDLEFAFKEVQELFKETVTGDKNGKNLIAFIDTEESYKLPGGIIIQHGHQYESANKVDYTKLILTTKKNERVLNAPWGNLFFVNILNELKSERPHADQVKPFSLYLLLSFIFDFRFAFKALFKSLFYFFKTAWSTSLGYRRNVSRMIQIFFSNFILFPQMHKIASKKLKANPNIKALIMGHCHDHKCLSVENKQMYINTGSWVRSINLNFDDFGVRLNFPYAFIEYFPEDTTDITLYEWIGNHKNHRAIMF